MYNNHYLREKILEEHRHNMQCEMAQRRLLARIGVLQDATTPLGWHIVSLLGTRLIAIGMRLERVEHNRVNPIMLINKTQGE